MGTPVLPGASSGPGPRGAIALVMQSSFSGRSSSGASPSPAPLSERRSVALTVASVLLVAACSSSEVGTDAGPGDAAPSDASPASDASAADAAPASDAAPSDDAGRDAAPSVDAAPTADAAAPSEWSTPSCTSIIGTRSVTFTRDEGASLAPVDGALTGVAYTFGLAALETPNTLLVAHNGNLLRSTDAGCRWTSIGSIPTLSRLLAADGDRAYGWVDNDAPFVRIEGTTITTLRGPAPNVLGLGVDPDDGDHLVAAESTGRLLVSTDAGESWEAQGVAPFGDGGLVYRVAFDPRSVARAFAGAATDGLRRTIDGGATWTTPTGLPSRWNAFNVIVSTASSNYVWVEGLDITDADTRKIWLSVDGGASFTSVVTESEDITLINGNLLATHPTDPDILYFVFGTYFQGYGTDIYRYDHGRMRVSRTHNAYDEISSIAFSPADPHVMYLGVTSEDIH